MARKTMKELKQIEKEIKRRIDVLSDKKLSNQKDEFKKGKIRGYENVLLVIKRNQELLK